MADIFISYSSKDRAQAEQLIEMLASAGLSVWIDRVSIELATSWSGEIVEAIENCKAFVVLLSPNSIESVNVAKEVSLAAEKRKKIVPLDLEPVTLSRDLQYHLAGLQRSPMMNIDAVIRVFGKLGLEAKQSPSFKLVRETDDRKSLMILPFEDLSPTGDNAWFAEGIVSELISALSNVKALRLMDAATTKEFKSFKGHLTTFASEMSIRYFVQGDVRKFGDNIKITSRLLDIETGDYLWQDAMKGTMEDIFDIQEKVAENVVEGLKLVLSKEEEAKLAEKPTRSVEAYEFYLKGMGFLRTVTENWFEYSMQMLDAAIAIDPKFAAAHFAKASAFTHRFRTAARQSAMLDRAIESLTLAESIEGPTFKSKVIRGNIAHYTGHSDQAVTLLREAIELAPNEPHGYSCLAGCYFEMRRYREAYDAQEQCIKLAPTSWQYYENQIYNAVGLGDASLMQEFARNATPVLETAMARRPEYEFLRLSKVGLCFCRGDRSGALRELESYVALEGKRRLTAFEVACVSYYYQLLGYPKLALQYNRLAIERGYRIVEDFRRNTFEDPEDQAEHEAMTRELEALIEKETHG